MSSVADPETIISDFVQFIRPAFIRDVANTAFSASLFTLCVVLLALSTKQSRRHVVFRLNVFAICLVLTMGILVGFNDGKVILGQVYWLPQSNLTAGVAFAVLPPLLCDSILLARLFALYPLSITRPATLLKIFIFPFCIKCARVVVLAHYLVNLVTLDSSNPFHDPYLTAEWMMQAADNIYSVGFFLHSLRVRTGLMKCGGMSTCIRQIFYISVANFVFPLMFNIVLIICVMADQSFGNFGGLLLLINNYVTVMGVLCATVWFSRLEQVRTRNEPLSDGVFALEEELRIHNTQTWAPGP
ncbi:hypothetical protein F5141DRAFT_1253516 [Pisolithus sp. B1]|nr:hypothetical protein F5141DRAFT_1253516 [Pisolithus sp. B1]